MSKVNKQPSIKNKSALAPVLRGQVNVGVKNGKPVVAKKKRSPENRTIRRSVYSILIQTNKKPVNREHAQHLAERLDSVIRDIFGDTDELQKILRWNWQQDSGNLENHLKLPPIVDWSVEEGHMKMGGRIHAHLLVRFVHDSNFWLDRELLKPLIIKEWNKYPNMWFDKPMESVLVRVKNIQDTEDAKDYIYKEGDPRTTRPDLEAIERHEGSQRAALILEKQKKVLN